MNIALAVLTTVAVMVAAWAVSMWWDARTQRVLESRTRSEVIVTLKTDQSFSGVLYEHDTTILILRKAMDLQPQAAVPVDGELLLRWVDVAFIQVP